MNKATLKWNDWGDPKKIPKEIKLGELILIEIERVGIYKYRTGIVEMGGDKQPMCTIGDHFLWDRNPIRWASIQHLIEDSSHE